MEAEPAPYQWGGVAQPAAPPAGPDEAERRKGLGGECFRAGEYESALAHYGAALRALDDADAVAGVGAAALGSTPLRSTLGSNQALCLLRLERYAEAEACASEVLRCDPGSSKALYRRGQARLHMGNSRDACDDLHEVARLEPQNREIRQRYDDARREADAAEKTHIAAGGIGEGLYEEKPDVNEGRLAETHRDQKEWIQSITSWTEIVDVSFAEASDRPSVTVYMALPGIHEIPPNKVCVWLTPQTMEVRVIELHGKNWNYIAQELWSQIDPEACSWKVKTDKLVLKLQKRASARSWDKWDKIRRI